jgi:hypothetical protein
MTTVLRNQFLLKKNNKILNSTIYYKGSLSKAGLFCVSMFLPFGSPVRCILFNW